MTLSSTVHGFLMTFKPELKLERNFSPKPENVSLNLARKRKY